MILTFSTLSTFYCHQWLTKTDPWVYFYLCEFLWRDKTIQLKIFLLKYFLVSTGWTFYGNPNWLLMLLDIENKQNSPAANVITYLFRLNIHKIRQKSPVQVNIDWCAAAAAYFSVPNRISEFPIPTCLFVFINSHSNNSVKVLAIAEK